MKNTAQSNSRGASTSRAKIKDTCGYSQKRARNIGGCSWRTLAKEIREAFSSLSRKKTCYHDFNYRQQ